MELRDVMTPDPIVCSPDTTATKAAELMRDHEIGDVLVQHDGSLGIVTDRDIAIRAVAAGRNPNDVTLSDISTRDIESVSPDTSIDDVIRLMSDRAVRRVPVVDDGKPVGIVALGDLAVDRDRRSLLGDISAAPPSSRPEITEGA